MHRSANILHYLFASLPSIFLLERYKKKKREKKHVIWWNLKRRKFLQKAWKIL